MKNRIKEIVFPLFLGLLFPMILFPMVTNFLPEAHRVTAPNNAECTNENGSNPYNTVAVKMEDGRIVEFSLESYVLSVVLREMPADFHPEALKAQAVVARTYTLRHLNNEMKHQTADLCTDASCCQGFWDPADYLRSGGSSERVSIVAGAVRETAGMILVYDGKPIESTYFSCSGGTTEDAVAVWGTDVPYLKSTTSPGEEGASHYTDTVRFSVKELTGKLEIDLENDRDFKIGKITYTTGGGVDTMIICGKKFHGTELRKLLGLRSTAFVMTAAGSTVTVTTKGFGHRVGMSQYGAEAMALAGSQFMEILLHYYQGVELVSIHDLY